MSKSVLTGVQQARFKNFDLAVQLVDWQDTRKPRLARHEFLKRDGGYQEPMGRDCFTVKMNLVYVGPSWLDQFKPLAASVDDDPKGILIHPIYGQMRVACQGFDAATVNTETGRDMYLVPVSFIEDNVDQKLGAQVNGLAAQQQQVTTYCAQLNAVTQFAAAAGAIQNLTNAAISFSAAAFSALANAVYDSTLQAQLDGVEAYAVACRSALLAAAGTEALVYSAIALVEQIYDACIQLLSAISASRPPVIAYTVPAPTHIASLAAKLYGSDGRSRIPEILAYNPGKIPNPSLIAAGTVLLVSQPTV